MNNFKDSLLLSYFDMSWPTYIFTDAHITGLDAILYQGGNFENLKPVAIASCVLTRLRKTMHK